MKFEWDATNVSHIARHKVTPDEAEQALRNDPFDLCYEMVGGEERWTSIGHADNLRVLLLVWTLRGEEVVRVVTARGASKTAGRVYLREKGFGL
ncbi:MAG: hypothetical protein A3H28_04280 [Acidobacteria bacterium RIFCSPLOWO2_02_FULL_61_28]|nr:MAG: hypothetical protein A3H28_04280 [Acidobacteria bacterium RIFCSPLOWO2_02_FULL_61_28]